PRTRRMHISQLVIDALKGLPRRMKINKNNDIADRNAARKLKNAEHATDPIKFPDAASDEESLITVSDEAALFSLNIYIPLSIFTSPNLEILNATAATVDTKKLNAANPTEKQSRVLDTAAFEAKYLKEIDLDRAQWHEAARNYVAFVEEVCGADSKEAARWNAHFGFFDHVDKAEAHYIAILATDIALRLKYSSLPFTFDRSFYTREL
ncbi:hypothetical protein C8R44DRAFT_564016, partial [Mycena epipterygia]